MTFTQQELDYFQQLETEANDRRRRTCTRVGFRFGGLWGMITMILLGDAVPLFALIILSATPFWQTISIETEHQIIGLILAVIFIVTAVVPFVFLKPKYALLAEIGTALYVIVLGITSDYLNSLFMAIVTGLWNAGARF